MAFDTPNWGGYWRGPAWPRIFSYVSMALSRAGHGNEGFTWLSRAIHSNLGPLLPETVDPKAYPPANMPEARFGSWDTTPSDVMVFPDVAGLRTWGGDDLTVAPAPHTAVYMSAIRDGWGIATTQCLSPAVRPDFGVTNGP